VPAADTHQPPRRKRIGSGLPNLNRIEDSIMTNQHPEYNDAGEDSKEPRGSMALILSVEIVRMPDIVRLVRQVPGTKVLYQRVSAGRLRVIEEK
jgi:hypothetical protein